MKYLKILLYAFLLTSGLLSSELKPFDIVKKELDKNIFWLITTHPNQKSVVEKFGKPQLDEKNKIYYALNDYKYSLCMKFNKDRVVYVNYKMPSETNISIKDFVSLLKAEEFSLYPSEGHDKGRFLSVILKKEKIQLIFVNNSEKKLARLIYGQN